MGKASYVQTSFLGGEFSPFAQGRMEKPEYRTAMNVCRNTIPVEEGAAVRRPGTRTLETTRKGRKAVLKAFHFTQAAPYNMELTDSILRFFAGDSLVLEAETFVVVDASTANPAVLTTNDTNGWATGDAVKLYIQDGTVQAGVAPLLNRTFQITVLSADTFSIADPVTGLGIDGSGLDIGTTLLGVQRVLEFATPYTEALLPTINIVQDETHVLLMSATIKPRIVEDLTAGDVHAFSFSTAEFLDGPYLDPEDPDALSPSFLTPSGTTGTITLTETGGFYAFVATDVGRLIRLYSSPPNWVTGTSYTVGDSVTFRDNSWTALTDNHGKQPDISLDDWALDPSAITWTWAKIATVTSSTVITATIKGVDLLSTNPVTIFRLGVYSDTTGWPTCGTLHEGRLWLGGPVGNRFDASMSNEFLRFDPTQADGTVADNNGISEVIRAPEGVNKILWMMTDNEGIVMGSQAGEWLVRSSSLNDPLTPTSIQQHQMTKYGSLNTPPTRTDMSILFVHRYGRKVIEYTPLSLYSSGRYGGSNLSQNGKHLAVPGIQEIVYQQELTPVLWARCGDGSLIGCSYKRDNPGGTEPADFAGWHRHDLGSERLVTSLQVGPSLNGELDSLMLVTKDPTEEVYQVELLTNLFDQDTPIYEAWFVDSGVRPSMAEVIGTAPNQVLRLYSLDSLEGQTVSVFAAGVDVGDFAVTNGVIDIPFGTTGSLLNAALLAEITATGDAFENIGVYIKAPPVGDPSTVDALLAARYTRSGTVVEKTTFGSGIGLWPQGKFISISAGDASTDPSAGFRAWDIAGQAMTGAQNVASLAFPDMGDGATPLITDTVAADTKGFLYFNDSDANYGTIVKLDPTTWTFLGGVGQANSGSGVGFPPKPNGPLPNNGDAANYYGIPNTANLICGETSSKVYVFNASADHNDWGAGDGIHVINGTDMLWLAKGQTFDSYTGGQLCHAPGFHRGAFDFGSAYLLGSRLGGLVADDLTSVTLYRLGAAGTNQDDGALSSAALGTILPTDIDGAATKFTKVSFGLYDESDGNIIWSCELDTGTKVISKMSSRDATVLWTQAVDDTPSDQSLRLSRCVGKYAFYSLTGSGPWNYYVLDTADGSLIHTYSVATIQRLSTDQFWDDVSARVIFKGEKSSGDPASVAPTPDTFSEDWLTLPGTPATIPYPPNVAIYYAPISVGSTYISQGQILRPIAPDETGAANGPALGKTRRTHMFSALLHRTQGISFGTVFGKLNPAKLHTAGGTPVPLTTLYSGTIQDTLTDDYSFDSMLAWQISRPYPATVLTIGGFIQTQDR